jgi:hypothetical protein
MFKSVLETLSDTEIMAISHQLANPNISNKSIVKQLKGKSNYNFSEIKGTENEVLVQLLLEVNIELVDRLFRYNTT